MKISFHGAAQTVTGSKHLINLDNGTGILLDCGLFQGMGARTQTLNEELGFDASTVSVVLLSHAHIDHSGLLPKLVAEGYTGKIYCTQATRELAAILLQDSAQIQVHEYHDKHHQPAYTLKDVGHTLARMEVVAYDEWFDPLPGVSVLYTRTGHLVGAAAIHLKMTDGGKVTTLSYSADVGRARHPLLKPATPFPQAEYIILESTYGDKHHEILLNNVDNLLGWIKRTCLEKKGKLIIPAFSVGRTQEILFLLNQLELEKRLPDLKYFIDSPLAIKATEIIKSHTDEFNDNLQKILLIDDDTFAFTGLKYVETPEDSIRLQDYQEPCVIIASSGTADAGRVRFHIGDNISEEKNAILFSGYCGPESLGGELIGGAREIVIDRESQEVRAAIGQMKGLSAHGDSDDLCQFVSCQDPGLVRGVFLVHGEHRAQDKLAARLAGKGFYPVVIPAMHEVAELNIHAKDTRTDTEDKQTAAATDLTLIS